MPRPPLDVAGISIDCADPLELAHFYLALLGGELLWDNSESSGLRTQSGLSIVAQKVANYVPPVWPSSSIVHFDVNAGGDLAGSVAYAVECGAREAAEQPDPRWRVLLDPAGHPFCITTEVYDG
ncbi:MAG: VOC family protein [Rhodococcus sp. (in: high G+C Gram-positive bacteria)]|uniref:VOC family protein n=1 Tax=Rhodococcus sp. TaxID=1831 RepID=UPI002ADA2096|nr:VOC family protein [Rhodococcus sp. (in: high G+C Gram-positive bacteria)]MDZ7930932.1 VOC family protein [Rhodococcus sp. (in: high G+C Gram-positive bacteria)]